MEDAPAKKRYLELTISHPGESREALVARLAEMDCRGLEERDTELVAYFEGSADIAALAAEISDFRRVLDGAGLDSSFSFHSASLPEADWNETWKEQFMPLDVGERLTVIPSWLEEKKGRLSLVVDPRMAFGTGHHETTRTCLELIERVAADTRKRRFLDVGTGSGILAIAASRLGFDSVTAVDTDSSAIDEARRNVEANGLGNVEILEGDIELVSGSFDLIAANLLSGILLSIVLEIVDRLEEGGIAILSGMLCGQEEEVREAYEAAGLMLREAVVADKWVTLVLSRQARRDAGPPVRG